MRVLAVLFVYWAAGCAGSSGASGDNSSGDDDQAEDGQNGDDGNSDDGGGDDSPGRDQLGIYESGSRIKMRVGRTPDGAVSFEGWYDTELDTVCYFGTAADGRRRCLPEQTAYPSGDTQNRPVVDT